MLRAVSKFASARASVKRNGCESCRFALMQREPLRIENALRPQSRTDLYLAYSISMVHTWLEWF
ncbi:MAG: hypothetical protein CXZ00_04105 [Acidobacteria bacterium]|nr:MAG: hypothetical protein CXZ00_04105 [Acidobacteriota bacterium]